MSAPPSPIVLHTVPLLYSDESLKDNVCPPLPYRSSYCSPTVALPSLHRSEAVMPVPIRRNIVF